jgi:hypothetical protein
MAKSWMEMTGSDVMAEWYREPGGELLAEFMERVIREVVEEVRAEEAEARSKRNAEATR